MFIVIVVVIIIIIVVVIVVTTIFIFVIIIFITIIIINVVINTLNYLSISTRRTNKCHLVQITNVRSVHECHTRPMDTLDVTGTEALLSNWIVNRSIDSKRTN